MTMTASPTNKKNVIRSRFPNYRFRDIQFVNGIVIVDDSTLARMKKDPRFGQGQEMWLESTEGVPAEAEAPAALKLAGSSDGSTGKKDDAIEVPPAKVLKEMLEGALENEVVTRGGGGHYMFADGSLGQNEAAVIAKLESSPELYEQLATAIAKARAGEQPED